MLSYRLIDSTHAQTIWNAEQSAPRWFREASRLWTPTFEDYVELLWSKENEVWGLFDEDNLVAAVYLEFLSPSHINIHISVIGKVKEADLVRFFVSLKNTKAIEGITVMVGWVLGVNRGLLRIVEKAGFGKTGLTMRYGASRGKVMTWMQVRA